MVRLLLAAGANPDVTDAEDRHPLDVTKKAGFEESAKLLA